MTSAFQYASSIPMRLGRRLIACYLALCFAFAGAVGVSPILHRLIEHGGQGPDHTHNHFVARGTDFESAHQHGDAPLHRHTPAKVVPRPAAALSHSFKPFELPKIPLNGIWRALNHFLAVASASESSPSKDKPRHEHHSLFQLIVSGLVEQPLDVPILSFVPFEFISRDFVAEAFLAAHDWDAQTASRAPPLAKG